MMHVATRDTSGHVNTMELTINDAYEIPTEQSHRNLNSFKLLETKKTDGYVSIMDELDMCSNLQ